MSDTQEAPVLDITASADGRRNAYSSQCKVIGQVMNYAACQWRQHVLAGEGIRTPADWAPCAAAGRNGTCQAITMREEELLAGKSIYFVERRSADQPLVQPSARRWIDNAWKSTKAAVARAVASPPPAPPVKRATSELDAMGDMGSYADALNALSETPAAAPPPVQAHAPAPVSTPAAPPIPMLPGESPLAYAKRVREAQTNPTT